MKKRNHILCLITCIFLSYASNAQSIISITADYDAVIGFHDNYNSANNNNGTSVQLLAFTIPGASGGLNGGRSLIRFDLSTIPTGATITNSKLNLYVLGSWNSGGHWGTNNNSVLQRVTENWVENTVTWNTKPSSTTQNQVFLPQSTSPLQDYLDIDVTLLTRDMQTNNNYGFLLKLVNEVTTNGLVLCSSDYTDSTKHPKLVISYTLPNNQPVLTVSKDTLFINKEANSLASVDITSNLAWSAVSNQPWLKVSPASSTGNKTLTFTAQANPTESARTATVTVAAAGVEAKTITVTQKGIALLVVDGNTVSIASGYGSTASVKVTSNIEWNVVCEQTWLWVSPKNSSGNKTLEFTAASTNPKTTTRSATVTVLGDGVAPQLITVTQAAGDIVLTVTQTTINIGYAEGSIAWTGVTSNTNWTAVSDQNWLTVSPSSSSGNKNLVFTANANPGNFNRTATVTLSATGATTQVITIIQTTQPTIGVFTDTVYIAKYEGSTAEIAVSANVAWRAVPEFDWLAVSPGSGEGDGKVTFTAQANPGVGKRAAVVSISGVETGIKRVTVIQDAGDPTITVSAANVSLTKGPGSNAAVTVTSNTNWSASSGQTLLAVTPVFGTGNDILILTAETNATVTERTATVTVSVADLEPKLITVTQAAGDTVLTVSDNEISIGGAEGSTTSVEVTSNISWTAKTDQDWITFSPASGTGNATITFTAKANPSKSDRPVYVIVSSGTYSQAILVVQLPGKGTGAGELLKNEITLFPNPVTDGFRVRGLEGRATLIISDMTGKTMLSKAVESDEYISVNSLAKGIYVIRIATAKGMIEKKMVKE